MATVSWVTELDKKEHKNWVMVGCALNIAKNGITPLIQRKMETWYQSLISSPPLQSLPACTCTPGSPVWCGTCVTWRTELKRYHKFNQPKIPNSDRTQWGSPAGAWEIAKVFMSALGSRKAQVVDAETTDIGGLLNLLEQCPFIQPPVNPTVLSSVREQCRNHWAHAPKQELQDADVNTIFGHLNNLLNDPVFNADNAAQKSCNDLQDLHHQGLVAVTESEVDALHLLRQSLAEDLADFQDKLVQLDAETKKVNEAAQKDLSKVKEEVHSNREEIALLSQQIPKILTSVKDFNRLLNEREDLCGSIAPISEDVEDVKRCMQNLDLKLSNVVIEQNETKSQVANLQCEVATNKSTISDLQKDVMEVKEEVETLKAKPREGQNSDESDALCTAPSRLTVFTGREAALTCKLEQNLDPDQSSENCPGTSCCTKAICGLGEWGKTSLAVEFSLSFS